MSAKKAILVVDDEALILLSLRQELKLAFGPQFTYESAMTAQDALAAIERLRVHDTSTVLIISDWLMPGLRGDELLRVVHAKYPAVKLVLLSGHAEDRRIKAITEELGL